MPLDLANWRAVVAPPGISAAEQAALTARVRALVASPRVARDAGTHRLDRPYLDGPAFRQFLLAEQARVHARASRRLAQAVGTPRAGAGTPTAAHRAGRRAVALASALARRLAAWQRRDAARDAAAPVARLAPRRGASSARASACRRWLHAARRASCPRPPLVFATGAARARQPPAAARRRDRRGRAPPSLAVLFAGGLDVPLPHGRVVPMNAFAALCGGLRSSRSRRRISAGALLGVTLGTAVGVLPGIGPALTVALLLPVTYGLDPTAAFIMFAGIYYGGMYGGSTTSILLNTPGESATIVTALEGHQMARRGRAGAALATAAIGSFVAGTLGTLAPHRERAGDGAAGAGLRPGRLLRAHRRSRSSPPRRCSATRARAGLLSLAGRRAARPHRHRPAERRGAADLRRAVSARRPRPDDRRHRPLRRRRDAGAGRRRRPAHARCCRSNARAG